MFADVVAMIGLGGAVYKARRRIYVCIRFMLSLNYPFDSGAGPYTDEPSFLAPLVPG
jgi:hypothetical protein